MLTTIEDILISRGQLDRIYKGEIGLYLWRALLKSSNGTASMNPLYPDFEERIIIRNGVKSTRFPDIKTKEENGIIYVFPAVGKSGAPDGTSLFDREGTFGNSSWEYFEIPKGTKIPVGLIITRDEFNSRFNATHYTLTPNYKMPKIEFIKLLDELRLNAIRQRG